jgi:hypothetical protein
MRQQQHPEISARLRIADDFTDLSLGCQEALDGALKDGERKYAPGEWRRVAAAEHLLHADNHARAALAGCGREELRVHLTHLPTRAAMAWELFQEEEAAR